ncbi:MAG: redox-sensing transcriptional repressor Rex [Sedimentisphaerales bacterium]|nr:redox-sensing transcriptional repressor Rex [Sedimentisphaerales bacterium]
MANRSCVIRLSRYKNALNRLKALNFVRVFSDNLADAAGVTAAQVRKDFSLFGITGNRRGGYRVDELAEQLNKILGKDQLQEVIVVGIGNIGRALLHYPGLDKSGIRLAAGFDIDPGKVNRDSQPPALPLEELVDVVGRREVKLGVIAVPDYAAQQVLELMLSAGIRGVLNFAPICLKSPEGCIVHNINLESELENLIYFVNATENAQ